MARYGVARATAQAALRLLQSEGLVASRQGAGGLAVDRVPGHVKR
jgi:DNA-binding GntR family transcriptional regulator